MARIRLFVTKVFKIGSRTAAISHDEWRSIRYRQFLMVWQGQRLASFSHVINELEKEGNRWYIRRIRKITLMEGWEYFRFIFKRWLYSCTINKKTVRAHERVREEPQTKEMQGAGRYQAKFTSQKYNGTYLTKSQKRWFF